MKQFPYGTGYLDVLRYRKRSAYHSSQIEWASFADITLVSNTIYATPFWVADQSYLIDEIGIVVATGIANAKARAGIYFSGPNNYPSSLLIETNELDCGSTGAKSSSVNGNLYKERLYWFVCLANDGIGVRGVSQNKILGIFLGYQATGGGGLIYHSQAFGSLPSTFPSSSPTYPVSGNVPLVFVKLN